MAGRDTASKLFWFFGLWLGGVVAVGCLGLLIKLALS